MASQLPVNINTAGRQPVIDYLTKDYAGFRQGMLNQIPLLLPQWTDRSEADFGVVLIELFAYVADILSYYQDRMANEAFLATATQRRSVAELLRLINYEIDPGLAASALIHVEVTADVTVAGPLLPYRLKTTGVPGEPDVTFEVADEFSLKPLNNAVDLTALAGIPAGSTAIVIARASHALADGHAVYFEQKTTAADGSVRTRRSPPLTISAIRDAGGGNDEVNWLPPLPEPFTSADTTLNGNNVVATNGVTIADEPIFVGDGTPGQAFTLSRIPVTHRLRPGESQRRRSQPDLDVRVDGVRWAQVESLFASLPADTHYTTTIDEHDYLTIRFGTGARGSIPPAGAQISARYRIGLGSKGNVGADKLSVFLSAVPEVKAITNPFPAHGGADRESTEEAKISGPGSVIAQERAVTLQDYELLAEAFPGVGKAKARVGLRGGYKVVQVFIAPEDPQTVPPPLPSDELKDSLEGHLHSRMPVNRMAGVDVLDPRYVPVDITVDVFLQAESSQSAVFQRVRSVLRALLSFARQDFGQPVRVGEVFATLYPVEGITHALLRRLARSGAAPIAGAACDFEDVAIAEHELAYEGLLTINLFGGVR